MGTFSASGGSSAEQHEAAKQVLPPIANGILHMVSSSTEIIPLKSPDDFLPFNGHERPESGFDNLPADMVSEILSRLPDARDQAWASSVNARFRASAGNVKQVKFLCRLKNVQRCPGQNGEQVTPFKKIVMNTVRNLKCVERLRLEIEDEMQANRFKEDVIEKNSLWLSEDKFVKEWLPPVSASLKSLTVIDYGQQAIFHQTPLLQHLSNFCKHLRLLELRNMFLDCAPKQCGTADQASPTRLPQVITLTLRCVKLTENGLWDLNECMPLLETLTLVTVVGLRDAKFTSDCLKVLCLGLATKVKSVRLEVRSLVKLQLKMACPDDLKVTAPKLQCLAVCMDKRPGSTVVFEEVNNLRELLMGASEFSTLHTLCSTNKLLERVFLDVPCMAFEDNGGWKGVLLHVPLNLPDMKLLRVECTKLHTLSVGPGLWYSLEQDMKQKPDVFCPTWPVLTRLILHLIVEDIDVSMKLLKALVESIPTLNILEVYVHKDSKVDCQEFGQLTQLFPTVQLKLDSWKKGLKFECFSF